MMFTLKWRLGQKMALGFWTGSFALYGLTAGTAKLGWTSKVSPI
jgi:hypothetical protein